MRKLNQTLVLIFIFFNVSILKGQDINAVIDVDASQVQRSDKSIFQDMKNGLLQFVNQRKWCEERMSSYERIECTFVIQITKILSSDEFEATVRIQSSRPVYNTTYNSVLFNHSDELWQFQYVQFQPLDYQEGQNINQLTSLMAYYLYIIVGLDYDSFHPNGGDKYFNKALALRSACLQEYGWKPTSGRGNRNRYYLIDNILDDRFSSLRMANYQYHLQGLDVMAKEKEEGEKAVFQALLKVKEAYDNLPNSMIMRLWFTAKREEIINIFSHASPTLKSRAKNLLMEMDPGSRQEYEKGLK